MKVLVYYSLNGLLALIASSKLAGLNLVIVGENLVLSLLSIVALVLAVYLYNDLTDVEIDRINKLNRPLITGEATVREAWLLILALSTLGLMTALTINIYVFFFSVAYFVLFMLYSYPGVRLKRLFLVNKLTVATGVALSSLMGGATAGVIPVPIVLMAAYAFMSGLSTNLIIDFRDIGGDTAYAVATPSSTWNPKLTIRLAMALIGMIGIAVVVGFLQLGFNAVFIVLAACGFAAWMYVLYPLFTQWNNPTFVANLVHRKISTIGLFIQSVIMLGVAL